MRGIGPAGAFAAIVTISMAVSAFVAMNFSAILVLPVVSGLLIFTAFAMAALAWRQPAEPNSRRITYKDLSGVLTLIGCAAALLSEPEEVLPLLEARQSK